MNNEDKKKFSDLLKKFSDVFENGFNKELAQKIKPELNSFNKNNAKDFWLEMFRCDCPVEEINENTYEIHDIVNFSGEGNFDEYIHIVKIEENDTTSAIFMKFYYVLYCLTHNIKSNTSHNFTQ
jgi:hypothetical protein